MKINLSIRKILISLLILIILLIIPTTRMLLGLIFMFISFQVDYIFQPNQTPLIKYAEFPFRIEYQIEGEPYVIEDELIIEFDKLEDANQLGQYKQRVWKSKFASGKDEIVLLEVEGTKKEYELNNAVKTKIIFSTGLLKEYYMGFADKNDYYYSELYFTKGRYEELIERKNNEIWSYPIEDESVLEDYGIKIISYEMTEPIKNGILDRWWKFNKLREKYYIE